MYQKKLHNSVLYKNNTVNDRDFIFVPEWKFTQFRNIPQCCEYAPVTSLPFLCKFLVLQY